MTYQGEWIERASLEALHGLLDAEMAGRLRASGVKIGAGFASVAGALPDSAITINRVIGLGLERPITRNEIAQAKAIYETAGAQRFFLQVHPSAQREAVDAACEELGLEKTRGWQKFSRGPDIPVPDVHSDLVIREIGQGEGGAFGRIICDAFDLGDAAIPWIARLPGRNGWRAFMAFDEEDRPVGTGGLFIKDGLGYTDFGATAPSHRGRGAQSANLAHRLRVALEAGCHRIYTCTGEEVPGDPQHSYKNILKMGFEEDYVRRNYAPPK